MVKLYPYTQHCGQLMFTKTLCMRSNVLAMALYFCQLLSTVQSKCDNVLESQLTFHKRTPDVLIKTPPQGCVTMVTLIQTTQEAKNLNMSLADSSIRLFCKGMPISSSRKSGRHSHQYNTAITWLRTFVQLTVNDTQSVQLCISTHRRKGNYNGKSKRGRNILINAIAAVIGCDVVQIILRPVSSILFYVKH